MTTPHAPSAPREREPAAPRARSRARLWLFRLLAATLVPALFFIALEFGLRAAGVGYPPAFFVAGPVPRTLTGNARFGWTYFPPAIARAPEPFVYADPKPAGTYRIVLLGSSAALGFPEPAFGMARVLEAMLGEAFPRARFEVVNAAMVAINSHVVRAIAADAAAAADPDLFIVYEGNNEVIGPWGPGTVFAGFSPSRGAIRASVALRRLRLGQLIHNLAAGVRGGKRDALAEWTGMEMFLGSRIAADDPRLDSVRDHFRANLNDVCDIAGRAGAGVILCTVGVNLRDCAPFASLHRQGLSEPGLKSWQAEFDRGVAALAGKDAAGALEAFEAAAKLDDRFAELHFQRGRALEALGRFDDARAAYALARDLDGLRFRTDSRLNEAIRAVAGGRAVGAGAGGVSLVDIERLFEDERRSPNGLPGAELFHEHCHMTFEGNYAIASALFADVVRRLPASIRAGAPADDSPEPPPLYRVAERLACTPFAEGRLGGLIVQLMQRPPFTFQSDHEDSLRLPRARVQACKAQSTPANLERWRASAFEQAARAPGDWVLRRQAGALAIAAGDLAGAETQLRAALDLTPFDTGVAIELGGVLVSRGRLDEAERVYRGSLDSPSSSPKHESDVYFSLGVVQERRGDPAGALALYARSLERGPSNPRPLTNTGLIHLRQGRPEVAEPIFRRLTELHPDLALGWVNLALSQSAQRKLDAAAESLALLIALEPSNAAARAMLGDLDLQRGRPGEALEHYRAADALAPNNAETKLRLGRALAAAGDRAGAAAAFAAALAIRPDLAEARSLLDALGAAEPARP